MLQLSQTLSETDKSSIEENVSVSAKTPRDIAKTSAHEIVCNSYPHMGSTRGYCLSKHTANYGNF